METACKNTSELSVSVEFDSYILHFALSFWYKNIIKVCKISISYTVRKHILNNIVNIDVCKTSFANDLVLANREAWAANSNPAGILT